MKLPPVMLNPRQLVIIALGSGSSWINDMVLDHGSWHPTRVVEKPQDLQGIRLPPESEVQSGGKEILDYRQLPKVRKIMISLTKMNMGYYFWTVVLLFDVLIKRRKSKFNRKI